jgi:hypothetical protein
VVAKAHSAGQRLLARLRQDAYSDLVAIAISSIPECPGTTSGETARRLRAAVGKRRVTPSTPQPDGAAIGC